MTITRRELLRRAGLLGAATSIASFTACSNDAGAGSGDESATGGSDSSGETGDDGLPVYEWTGDVGPHSLFGHGVASGDPLRDSVILWTRITVDQPDAELFFEVAVDPAFTERVAAGWLGLPNPERDDTVKIDLDGLNAATTYYYRFWIQGRSSPIGRTRTAPAGVAGQLRFAVCSCSSLAHGYFHNYRHIAQRADLDAVVHLGDYIYEYGTGAYGTVRAYEPDHEIVSLADYRTRYAQYRGDADLQEVHRQHPFITTWDDHEIANNGWTGGAENHDDREGDWGTRRADATRAYFEWMPIREGAPGRLYRDLAYGDLVDIVVLDTRFEGRDEQVLLSDMNALEVINDPDRQLLGEAQEAWLLDRLSSSTAQWKIIAQQVMMAQLIITPGEDGAPNRPFLSDLWDGYEASRRRILEHILDWGITDVIVVTGDIHTSWASELAVDPLDPAHYDPATSDGAAAVEFVAPGITSPGLAVDEGTIAFLQGINQHIKWVDLTHRGYMVLDLTPERVHCDWWHIPGAAVESPNPATPTHGAAWVVEAEVSALLEADDPAPEKPDPPALAP